MFLDIRHDLNEICLGKSFHWKMCTDVLLGLSVSVSKRFKKWKHFEVPPALYCIQVYMYMYILVFSPCHFGIAGCYVFNILSLKVIIVQQFIPENQLL